MLNHILVMIQIYLNTHNLLSFHYSILSNLVLQIKIVEFEEDPYVKVKGYIPTL